MEVPLPKDRGRTLAVLAEAGIQPYGGEEDDTEQGDEDEG